MELVKKTNIKTGVSENILAKDAVDELGYYWLKKNYEENPEDFENEEDAMTPDIGVWVDVEDALSITEDLKEPVETDTHSYIVIK